MAPSSDLVPAAAEPAAGPRPRRLERVRTGCFAAVLAALAGGALGTLLDQHRLEDGAALIAMIAMIGGACAGELADRR